MTKNSPKVKTDRVKNGIIQPACNITGNNTFPSSEPIRPAIRTKDTASALETKIANVLRNLDSRYSFLASVTLYIGTYMKGEVLHI